jgi:hypothetical protein
MVPATPAWAFVGIKCTSLEFLSIPGTGFNGALVALSGCDGNTGGGGLFTFWTTQHQIITWANGQTTTLSRAYLNSGTETDPDGGCYSPFETRISGAVKADTTGSAPVPGNYHYELCPGGGVNIPGVGHIGFPPYLEPGSSVKIG